MSDMNRERTQKFHENCGKRMVLKAFSKTQMDEGIPNLQVKARVINVNYKIHLMYIRAGNYEI